MSVIASLSSRRRLEAGWIAWIAVEAALLLLVPTAEAMQLHAVWLGAGLLYGLRVARWKHVAERVSRAALWERDFVRDACHQFRAPITVAGGYLELIRDQVKDPQAKRDANVALEELQRLARGAGRMLMLAMGDHVDFIARAPVDLGQVVGSAAQRWRSTAQRNWVVRIQAPGMVLGDGDRITEALDALIENAVKATGPGDRISVELRAEDEFAVLEVADSGIGLAYEHLDHVFDRFWRASRQGAGGRGGAGLGLAIVRGIAEAHGGSAEAGHTAGGGATFRVRLPGVAWLLRPATVDWPVAVAPGLGPSGADNGLSA